MTSLMTFGLPPIDGESAGWSAMHGLSRQDLSVEANYRALEEACDLTNFADYMLLHFFADAEDWPHHNGHAMRNRAANGPFKFYVWDQEIVLDNLRMKRYDASDASRPGGLFQQLRKSKEFRLLFADRVQKHLFNGGALSVKASQDRYMSLADQIDKAIVAESARWGDTQMSTPYGNVINQPSNPNNVDDLAYPPAPNGPDFYFTREDSWVVERDNVVNHYIPAIHDLNNSSALLNELTDEDLWPDTVAPQFNRHGGVVEPGFKLEILPGGGFRGADKLLYTMDGSDPREFGGNPSSSALTYDVNGEGVALTDSVTIKARLQSKSNPFLIGGEWSPLVEATFRVGPFGAPTDLQVSEVMYHPAPPSEAEKAAGFTSRGDFEFLELVNRGEGKVLLERLRFDNGISFQFPYGPGAELDAGGVILLVNNPEAMIQRYGDGLPIAGTFERGSQLANDGERLTLIDGAGEIVWSFRYDDGDDWPAEADGEGYSLVVEDRDTDLDDAGSWRASAGLGGSPGTVDGGSQPPVVPQGYAQWREASFSGGLQDDESVSGPWADPEGDLLANVFEYAFDLDPLSATDLPYEILQSEENGTRLILFRYPVKGPERSDVDLTLEVSGDLKDWTTEGIEMKESDEGVEARLSIAGDTGAYLRLRAELDGVEQGE